MSNTLLRTSSLQDEENQQGQIRQRPDGSNGFGLSGRHKPDVGAFMEDMSAETEDVVMVAQKIPWARNENLLITSESRL